MDETGLAALDAKNLALDTKAGGLSELSQLASDTRQALTEQAMANAGAAGEDEELLLV